MEETVRQLEMETLLHVLAHKDTVVRLALHTIHASIISVRMVPLVNKTETVIFVCVHLSIQEPTVKSFQTLAQITHV